MDQLQNFLFTLLHALVQVRIQTRSIGSHVVWAQYGVVQGRLALARDLGLITLDQFFALGELLSNAYEHSGKDFPGMPLRGPVMPIWIARERAEQAAVKPRAQVPAHAEQVSAPAASRELRLLCLLVPSRTGQPRALPVHTLRAMPPRVCVSGRWNLASEAGFSLRETQARAPSPEVLARCVRQRPGYAIRARA